MMFCQCKTGSLVFLCVSLPPACLSFAGNSWVRAGFDTHGLKEEELVILVLIRLPLPTPFIDP